MNITDIEKTEYPTTCWLEAIFKRQDELRQKYHHIEKANGLMQTEAHPLNIHDRYSQARLKDFSWRFTEELGEAHECLLGFESDLEWMKKAHVEHYHEELIDGLHFFTELNILIEITPDQIAPSDGTPEGRLKYLLGSVVPSPRITQLYQKAFETIMALGIASNHLKCRPWKNTHQMTDEKAYREKIIGTWYKFFDLLAHAGLNAAMVYDLYCRKSSVNSFRQKSNY